MKKRKQMKSIVILTVFLVTILAGLETLPVTAADVNTVWTSNGSSLIGWTQCNGDDDSNGYDSPELFNNDMVSTDGELTGAAGWWSSDLILTPQFAGLYREEALLSDPDEDWQITSKINFNNDQQSGPSYSFQGYMEIYIDNQDKEPMFSVTIRDPSGSSYNTNSYAYASYYDADSESWVYDNSGESWATFDFNSDENDEIGLWKDGSTCYWKVPAHWGSTTSGGITGNWIPLDAPKSTVLSRGTPTYIRTRLIRNCRKPIDCAYDSLTFKSSKTGLTEKWTSDGSSVTGWTQCNGDDDSNGYDSPELFNNDMVSTDGELTGAAGWWSSDVILTPQFAGLYRYEKYELGKDEWEVTSLINFNNKQREHWYYSFQGYMEIYIDNQDKEPMFSVTIRDPSGSTYNTNSYAYASYYDADSESWVYDNSGESWATFDFNSDENDEIGLKKTETGCYWKVPDHWSGTTGDWLHVGPASEVLSRGIPTYIRLRLIRNCRAPTDCAYDSLTFKSSESGASLGEYTEGYNYPVTLTGGTSDQILARSADERYAYVGDSFSGDRITGSDFGFPTSETSVKEINVAVAVKANRTDPGYPGDPKEDPIITIDVYYLGTWHYGPQMWIGRPHTPEILTLSPDLVMTPNDIQVQVRIDENTDRVKVDLDYIKCQIVYEGSYVNNPSDSRIEGYLYPDVCFTVNLELKDENDTGLDSVTTDEDGYFTGLTAELAKESTLTIVCAQLTKTWPIELAKGEYKILGLGISGDWARTLNPAVVAKAQELIYGLSSGATDYDKAEAIHSQVIDIWHHGNIDEIGIKPSFEKDLTILEYPFYRPVTIPPYERGYYGSCWHSSVLASSYCLAVGIPSRIIHIVTEDTVLDGATREGGYHFTTEFWNGNDWIPMDVNNAYGWFGKNEDSEAALKEWFVDGEDSDIISIHVVSAIHSSGLTDFSYETTLTIVDMSTYDNAQYLWYMNAIAGS